MSNIFARSSRSKRLSVLGITAGVFLMTASFQNCGKVGKAVDFNADSRALQEGNGGSHMKLTAIPAQTTNLGTKLTIPVTITISPNYSGTLKLEVDTPELTILDPGAGIKFSFDQASIPVVGGQTTAQVTLTVDVSTMSPSFDASLFHVHASDLTHPADNSDVSVPLQVKAIYEVQLMGRQNPANAAPEKWSVAVGSINKFINHPEGMTFRFINQDTIAHRVHSSGGPIPHEPTDMTANGGTYEIMIPSGTTMATSQVYCHDHEGGAQARTFQFYAPVVPVNVTPSGNPNATFTYLNTNVFMPSCAGCHSGSTPPAGVNLTSYANVVNFVVKGNASASAIYNVVAPPNPTMPLNGTPLTAAMVKNLSDWINDGAANN